MGTCGEVEHFPAMRWKLNKSGCTCDAIVKVGGSRLALSTMPTYSNKPLQLSSNRVIHSDNPDDYIKTQLEFNCRYIAVCRFREPPDESQLQRLQHTVIVRRYAGSSLRRLHVVLAHAALTVKHGGFRFSRNDSPWLGDPCVSYRGWEGGQVYTAPKLGATSKV